MSLANYTQLQSALTSAISRSDFGVKIIDCIALAEDKMNKRLRLRGMELRVTASISTEYISLPTGFLAMKNFQLNTTPKTHLRYATPDYLDARYPSGDNTDTPAFFTFIGGEIQLAPAPDTTYTAEMTYYEKLDLAADSTNWVLTNSPRIYYYGALREAYHMIKDERRASYYDGLQEASIREAELADDYDQIPDGDLAVRSVSAA